MPTEPACNLPVAAQVPHTVESTSGGHHAMGVTKPAGLHGPHAGPPIRQMQYPWCMVQTRGGQHCYEHLKHTHWEADRAGNLVAAAEAVGALKAAETPFSAHVPCAQSAAHSTTIPKSEASHQMCQPPVNMTNLLSTQDNPSTQHNESGLASCHEAKHDSRMASQSVQRIASHTLSATHYLLHKPKWW